MGNNVCTICTESHVELKDGLCRNCRQSCFSISLKMKRSKEWYALGIKSTKEEAEAAAKQTMDMFPLFETYRVEEIPFTLKEHKGKRGGVVAVKPKDLKEQLKANDAIQLLDVRESFEVESGMLPGAIHIPIKELPSKLNELEKGKKYVVYCSAGYRSPYICEFLRDNGFSASHLEGGMIAWKGAGFILPIVTGTLKTVSKWKRQGRRETRS
ncbi:rhodanese-like domain-containing protein [uncultured Rossellomorea sp.]|uniref:rhodanese-like domain-containing protein n=1 Tax=uncultured Rossellomorea sp. TaxID=2837549 RepID=UPI002605C769|nr:rhodanese-like domain-containing protein [uncultured Rossellomorea sp.]